MPNLNNTTQRIKLRRMSAADLFDYYGTGSQQSELGELLMDTTNNVLYLVTETDTSTDPATLKPIQTLDLAVVNNGDVVTYGGEIVWQI